MEPDSKVVKIVVALAVAWLLLLAGASMFMQSSPAVPTAASRLPRAVECLDAGTDGSRD